jgi:hypothetical protein
VIGFGGIGAVHKLVCKIGLDKAINKNIVLLKVHVPYWESDHVLNIAYNVLTGSTCLEDIERLRNDETYMNALDAERIPDPTTARDFLRRFDDEAWIFALQETINETRFKIRELQDPSFRKQAVIDVDGTIAGTTGECKEGINIAYNGIWGYAPVFVFLGIFMRPPGRLSSVAALVLLILGTTAAFVAVETGEAAGELVVRTPEISRVLQHHAELADTTLKVFLALTLLFASILLLPRILKKELAPRIVRSLHAIFLILYMAGAEGLINTAHQGGTLVHGLGIRAMMSPVRF